MVKSDKEAYKEDQDKYLPIVIQRNANIRGTVCVFGKTFDQIGKSRAMHKKSRSDKEQDRCIISYKYLIINYLSSSSQGFRPVCFLKAVEKWEIQE